MIISLSAPRHIITVGMSSLPGTLYGDLVRSQHGHARVNKIAKAAVLPGESCSIGLTNVADTPLWAQEAARILTGYVLSPLMY
ncbi:MAG: hypothetical protein WAV38_07565 [Xanthobacteraceae bacterium]